MGERSKVSYKIYGLGKAKHVNFHGESVLPLYIQVVFERNNIIFKSYYFDLFSKFNYSSADPRKIPTPSIKEIEDVERSTIEFIIEKLGENFSLDSFKRAYKFYSLDLCTETEKGFVDYMETYFKDEGLRTFATTVTSGFPGNKTIDLVGDFKLLFNKSVFERFIGNSVYYAPPYLPINSFAVKLKALPLRYISVREWEEEIYSKDFDSYLAKSYNDEQQVTIKNSINLWIEEHRKASLG